MKRQSLILLTNDDRVKSIKGCWCQQKAKIWVSCLAFNFSLFPRTPHIHDNSVQLCCLRTCSRDKYNVHYLKQALQKCKDFHSVGGEIFAALKIINITTSSTVLQSTCQLALFTIRWKKCSITIYLLAYYLALFQVQLFAYLYFRTTPASSYPEIKNPAKYFNQSNIL